MASAQRPVDEAPRFPAYGPDGTSLLCTIEGSKDAQNVYVMRRDGSGRRRLTHNRDVNRDPSWNPRYSPDGRRIVYWSGDNPKDFRVRVMNADGTHKQTIARGSYADWGRGVPLR
jgi:Tol biopolymer transport system component